MDHRLVAWARAVKARQGGARRGRRATPPLWLFTDATRMDPLEPVIAALPRGLCGVVFRHDGVPGRAALLRAVARRCRERRLALVVAGEVAAAPPGTGRHLRGGRGPRSHRLTTSSAHGPADLVRARRAGAVLVFLSPAFPTGSHPGARALGPANWARLAGRSGIAVLALGGITGATARRLPRWTAGAGAIGALITPSGPL